MRSADGRPGIADDLRSDVADAPARLGGDAVRRVLARLHAALVADRAVLDALNVFPVADGDTGANLVGTVGPIAAAAAAADDRDLVRAVRTAGLRAGRGNSGLIMSQWLSGWISEWDGAALDLVDAARTASLVAHRAVSRPVDGTILSVASAVAASDAVDAQTMRQHAGAALLATPRQLPVLAERGVVDAGGRGLLHVFDAIAVECGEAPIRDLPGRLDGSHAPAVDTPVVAVVGHEVRGRIVDTPGPSTSDRLRAALLEVGTDVVVADDHGEIAFHAHGDPGRLVTAVLAIGAPTDLHIEALLESPADRGAAHG